MSHVEYNKDKVEGHKLEIQQIFRTLNAPSSPLDKNLSEGECAPRLAPIDSHYTAGTSASESGTHSHPFAPC